MRLTPVIAISLVSLAACGERADVAAPSPTEQVAVQAPSSDGVTAAPVVLNADQLRQVCRAALAAVHGQDLSAVQVEGLTGQVVSLSWRAPVDGGVSRAECRVEGDVVTWRLTHTANPDQGRWMNQSGDPVTRFALDGEAVAITTTLPDGTTATEQYAVAAEQEAR